MFSRIIQIHMLIVLFQAFLMATAAFAGKALSFEEALERAMEFNTEIRAFNSSVLSKREDIGIARSFLFPKIRFEERFMRTNNPTYAFMAKLDQERFTQEDFAVSSLNNPAATSDFQTRFSFEQPLFSPEAYVGIDMARREFFAKKNEFERKREQIALNVFTAYLNVQTSRAFVLAAEKNIAEAREHLRIADARYSSELGLYSDRLRADVALNSAEEKRISAGKNLKVAKRALGVLLGMDESVDVLDERPSIELKSLEYYIRNSLKRSDLKALQERCENARNSLKLANTGYLPDFGIGGSYQMNDHGSSLGEEGESWQFMAFLKWELFDGTARLHERLKAKHRIEESEAYLDGMRKQISFRVYEAYLGVEEAAKGIELARKALHAAEEGKRLVKARYENSLSPMVDLLNVQSSLEAARAHLVGKESSYLTAIANLAYQSGTILKDFGIEK